MTNVHPIFNKCHQGREGESIEGPADCLLMGLSAIFSCAWAVCREPQAVGCAWDFWQAIWHQYYRLRLHHHIHSSWDKVTGRKGFPWHIDGVDDDNVLARVLSQSVPNPTAILVFQHPVKLILMPSKTQMVFFFFFFLITFSRTPVVGFL